MRQRAIRYGSRPPGQLTILLTALVLLCLGTGLASVLDVQHRRGVLAGVAERGGPLTSAAVEIYQSLSDADATAASAFLIGGVEPPELRDRYRANIIEADAALSTAAAGSPAGDSATIVTELSAYLPVYTGLIETARTYNRQGLPHGAAYLREASGLVHGTLLPSAQRLYQAETTRLAEAQSQASTFGWLPITLGILTLAGLVIAQVHLTRATRRILNAGLLAATLAALIAVTWYGVASVNAAEHNSAGRQEGSAAIQALAEVRIRVLQARSDEALTLVARGNGQAYEDDFAKTRDQLDGEAGLLAKAKAAVAGAETAAQVDNAIQAWRDWLASHQKLRKLDDDGDYNEAVRFAASTASDGPGALSSAVDGQLGLAIQRATERFDTEIAQARNVLSVADSAVAVLMVLAALGVARGFAPRLREFRR